MAQPSDLMPCLLSLLSLTFMSAKKSLETWSQVSLGGWRGVRKAGAPLSWAGFQFLNRSLESQGCLVSVGKEPGFRVRGGHGTELWAQGISDPPSFMPSTSCSGRPSPLPGASLQLCLGGWDFFKDAKKNSGGMDSARKAPTLATFGLSLFYFILLGSHLVALR